MRPSSMITMRGKSSRTISMSWVETSMVMGSSSSRWISERRARGSRPAVGSSSTSTSGCMESTVAMAMRFFSPTLRWCETRPRVIAHVHRRQGLVHALAAPRRAAGPGRAVRRPRHRTRWAKRAGHPAIGRPAPPGRAPGPGSLCSPPGRHTHTCPCPLRMPFRCRIRVDLPAPLGPTRATFSHGAMLQRDVAQGGVAVWVGKGKVFDFDRMMHGLTPEQVSE